MPKRKKEYHFQLKQMFRYKLARHETPDWKNHFAGPLSVLSPQFTDKVISIVVSVYISNVRMTK